MRISSLSMNQNSINNMLRTQERMSNAMEHISSGKKHLLPSDNPAETSRAQLLKDNGEMISTYNTNNTMAENYLSGIEDNLNSLQTTMSRINELTKQASSSLLSNDQRALIAAEIEENLHEVVSIANRTDSQGDYLFAGFRNQVQPYNLVNGEYQYQGDAGERMLQVGVNVFVPITMSGHDLFEKPKTGNGTFVTTDGGVTNTGTGMISTGHVNDANLYDPQEVYTINFVTNSGGKLGYTVVGAIDGQIIPSPPDLIPNDAPVFVPGQSIQFDGIEISISGLPKAGDDFGLVSSKPQNIFKSIQGIANAIKQPLNNGTDRAAFFNELDRQVASLDQGYRNILNHITKIGAVSNVVANERLINEDLHTHNEKTLSLLEDVDMTEAASRLSQEMTALEVAQKSYSKIQNLSLFNYL